MKEARRKEYTFYDSIYIFQKQAELICGHQNKTVVALMQDVLRGKEPLR